MPLLHVQYLQLIQTPAPPPAHTGAERISAERLPLNDYLALYQRAGFNVYLTRAEPSDPL